MFTTAYFALRYFARRYFPRNGNPAGSNNGILILDQQTVPVQFADVSVPLVYDKQVSEFHYDNIEYPVQFAARSVPIIYTEND